MGINLGAFLSPIVVGFLAQHIWFRNFISSMGFDPKSSWHFGFGAAGVGMTLGLIQYVVGRNRLRDVGAKPEKKAAAASSGDFDYITGSLAVVGGIVGAALGLYFGDAGVVSALFPCVVFFLRVIYWERFDCLQVMSLRMCWSSSSSFCFQLYFG